MPKAPYSPMRDPVKQVTERDMQTILARHASKPRRPERYLKWKRGGPWFIESDDGRFTVDKALVHNEPRYTAWQRSPKINLGCRDTADEAKALCEAKLRA
jgi:hypothetical protein